MAKKTASKKKAVPGDAPEAAAVRWYALKIELRALEIAMTNKAKFNAVRDILRGAKDDLERLEALRSTAEADCVPPWDICPDGICRPDCGDVRMD
jgi:hypothetical protein